MTECYYFLSGVCWKTTEIFENPNMASGKCESCLLAMQLFGFTNNAIPLLPNDVVLASGRHLQFNLSGW